MAKYQVFYSQDCMMYGVQKQVTGYSYTSEPAKWVQVLPPTGKGGRSGKSAYTMYQAVAKRWIKELQNSK